MTASLKEVFQNEAGMGIVYSSGSIYMIYTEAALRGVLRKSCSENIQQIYRRTPMTKCEFSKVAKATLLKSHFVMGGLL